MMQSSLIGKIEKAKRYAEEKDRVTFNELEVKFRGTNNIYTVSLKNNEWHCTCAFFGRAGFCSHTMAMEKILVEMLPPEAINTVCEPSVQ